MSQNWRQLTRRGSSPSKIPSASYLSLFHRFPLPLDWPNSVKGSSLACLTRPTIKAMSVWYLTQNTTTLRVCLTRKKPNFFAGMQTRGPLVIPSTCAKKWKRIASLTWNCWRPVVRNFKKSSRPMQTFYPWRSALRWPPLATISGRKNSCPPTPSLSNLQEGGLEPPATPP